MDKEKKKIGLPNHLIKILSIVLAFVFLLFMILLVGTSRSGLSILTNDYVKSQTVSDDYYESYEKKGYSKNQYYELLDSDTIRELTASVLSDRLSGIFHYDMTYEYNLSKCYNIIYEKIDEINEKSGVEMTEKNQAAMVNYTLDLTGISTMLVYDTPAAYRTAMFDADSEDFNEIDGTLSVLSKMADWKFPVAFYVMHLICIVVLFFTYRKNKSDLKFHVCSTMLFPSLLILAVAVGEIICIKTTSIPGMYLAKVSVIVSVFGIMIAIIETLISTIIAGKFGKENE